jgi:hypothetical protein
MILFGTGEDEVLTLLGAVVTNGSPGVQYRPEYARASISTGSGPFQHRFGGKLKAYLDAQPEDDVDFWYGFQFKGGGGFITGLLMFEMYDSSGKIFMKLTGNSSAGGMLLWTSPDGVNFTQYPGSSGNQPGAPEQQAFRIKIHPTLGRIEWWRAGGLWYKTPNFDTTALTSGRPDMVRGYAPNSNSQGFYSEIMATSADDPVVGLNLHTLPPIADGDADGWDGDYTRINELTKNTSTVISTAVDDVESDFINADVGSIPVGTVVRAIIHSGEYRTSALGAPQAVQPGLRIGGVTYPGDVYPVDTTPTSIQHIWEESPVTPGNQISESEVNDVQMAVISKLAA